MWYAACSKGGRKGQEPIVLIVLLAICLGLAVSAQIALPRCAVVSRNAHQMPVDA